MRDYEETKESILCSPSLFFSDFGDFVACLAQTPILPTYAEFTADAAVREHLHTAYQTEAPEWWRPQELSEGIYAQRRSSAKESHDDISVGLGRLPGENIRVYIGEFSAW